MNFKMTENAIIVTASVFASAIIAVGASLGATKGDSAVATKALECMARQPEAAGKIQTAMIIIGALLEGLAFGALILGA